MTPVYFHGVTPILSEKNVSLLETWNLDAAIAHGRLVTLHETDRALGTGGEASGASNTLPEAPGAHMGDGA